MATFKAEVYAHQKKQDGTYNIKIRVTHLGKKKYLATPFFVTQADLTRTLKIKNHRYIDLCDQIIRTYRDKCDDLGLKINDLTIEQLVEYITTREREFKLDFNVWVRDCITKEKNDGRVGTAQIGSNALRSWLGFLDSDQIDINSINKVLVSQFVEFLQIRLAPATIHSYIGMLSKFFNIAISQYNDVDDVIRNNPFATAVLPRIGANKKKALSIEQVKAIRDFKTDLAVEIKARDAFMLSFYLIGMNAVDLLTCTEYDGTTICYNRQKTKDRRQDGARMEITVPAEAKPIIEKYKARFGGRVFMFGERWNQRTFNLEMSRGMRQISAKLGFEATFYSARHSWATIAANSGIDIYTIHLALNHTSKSMAITETYIKRDYTIINNANRAVLDLLL